jgi:hypothetical protein
MKNDTMGFYGPGQIVMRNKNTNLMFITEVGYGYRIEGCSGDVS